MDLKKIGEFLTQLRKEHGFTQEQLGEKLGVTNKTVSRWETGTYLPPVECLQQLSDLYGLTINELLSAQRLDAGEYKEKAEENIKAVINTSPFSLDERIHYFKTKWKQEHRASLFGAIAIYILLMIMGCDDDSMLLQMIGTIFAFAVIIIRNNSMMIYVERHAYDTAGKESRIPISREVIMKRIRITMLVLLALAIWICIGLANNFFASQIAQINDGITVRGFWAMLFFGVDGYNWDVLNYYLGFMMSLRVTGGIGILNIILACLDIGRLKE